MSTTTATLIIDMEADLSAEPGTYHELNDLAIDGEGAATIDGVQVTADEAHGLLTKWVEACTAVWITEAARQGFEAVAAVTGSPEAHELGTGDIDAWQGVWDAVNRGDLLPTLAQVAQ